MADIAGNQTSAMDMFNSLLGGKGGGQNMSQWADILNSILGSDSTLANSANQYAQPVDLATYTAPKQAKASTLDPNAFGIAAGPNVDYQQLTPDLYKSIMQGNTNMNNINVNPEYAQKQQDTLSALNDIVQGGGLDAQGKAQYADMQQQLNAADKGRQGAIDQRMGMMGQAGSGMNLLQDLNSSQNASQNASQQGMDIQSQAMQRKLDALLNQNNIAAQMGQTQYGQQAQKAQAQDIINQFNTQNSNQNLAANAAMTNATNAANAANQYGAATANRGYNTGVNQYNQGTAQGVAQGNMAATNAANMYNTQTANGTNQANTNLQNQQINQNNVLNPQTNFNNQLKANGQMDSTGLNAAGQTNSTAQYQNTKQANDSSGIMKMIASMMA